MTNIRIALYRLIRRLTGRAAQASGVIQTGITHPQDLEDPFSDPSARERLAQVMLMKQARSLLVDRPKRNEAPRKRSFSRLEALELTAAMYLLGDAVLADGNGLAVTLAIPTATWSRPMAHAEANQRGF